MNWPDIDTDSSFLFGDIPSPPIQMKSDPFALSPIENLGSMGNEDDIWKSFMDPSKDLNLNSFGEELTIQDIERCVYAAKEKKNQRVPTLETKKLQPEKKVPAEEVVRSVLYKGLTYIGPTTKNRPNYKAKQAWEWAIYPHGISKQNGKLRVQIKQKGVNPTYPHFPNTYQGLLDAALFRDRETQRLWDAGILVRAPKFNFGHPNHGKRSTGKRSRRESQRKRRRQNTLKPPETIMDAESSSSTTHGASKEAGLMM
eukprot:CAMPEP_0170170416 /NCGR_PEP_ID=MMETSP0040_2-20121228/3413_1 /TAXON_ID=641309 /ORGANISM="Lotharella oceanica, Strain CCMP622" /LENGTH=255 /DNA_ID=CAMNT_0010409815 /DNA_START=160 /DNA_END=927 /DNA_ORIENTATION=+